MFMDKWNVKLMAPADEGTPGGDAGVEDTGGADTGLPLADGPGSGRSALRQNLEKNFEADRKATEGREAKAAKGAKGKAAPRRVAGGADLSEEAEPAEAPEGEIAAGAEGEPAEGAEETPKFVGPPPEALSKEAKADWAKTPATVQAAMIKREQDVSRGVAELKGRYADIDTALGPHVDAIRRHGHTPAQAVAQLFGWFQALAANPKVAFPALAKSFNVDLATITAATGQQPTEGQQPAGNIPPELQKYINDLQNEVGQMKQAFSQELGGLKSTFAQQSEAKTQEILTNWSKDKPHFESVRGLMAQLIQSGAVPLKAGQVDLDGAYDMALYANPDVRQQVLAAQQEAAKKAAAAKAAAEKTAQQTQADKARRAGVSVGSGAPGSVGAAQPGKKGGARKSVRESIMEAREQLTE